MKAKKYTIRKYEGDDKYSYAVFYKDDLRGPLWKQPIIFYGQAQPIVSGLSRTEALNYKKEFENGK